MLQQQLDAAVTQAAADGIRWREEVNLKQARIDMLAAGDRSKEADFMTQRVNELQASPPINTRQEQKPKFESCCIHPVYIDKFTFIHHWPQHCYCMLSSA